MPCLCVYMTWSRAASGYRGSRHYARRRRLFLHDLQVHTRNRPMAEDVNLAQVAQDLPGLSGDPSLSVQ